MGQVALEWVRGKDEHPDDASWTLWKGEGSELLSAVFCATHAINTERIAQYVETALEKARLSFHVTRTREIADKILSAYIRHKDYQSHRNHYLNSFETGFRSYSYLY